MSEPRKDPIRPVRVVIADDADDIRMLLRLSLAADGRFDVVGEAADGAAAVEVTSAQRPDAVVLDLSMPVMDGLQAASAIRRNMGGIRIVVLSGFTAEAMAGKAQAAGADAYIEKGSATTELAATLARLCGAGQWPPGRPAASRRTPAHTAEVMSFVTHELQTPLTALKGFAAVLRTGVDRMDRDTIVASADAIERSADNLTALTRSFADARAVEAGALGLVPSPLDLGALVEETVATLRTLRGLTGVTVAAGRGIRVLGDPVRLRQVVTNLLSNAAKFTPRDAPVVVEVWSADGRAYLSIADHGPGVAPEREHELFGKFSRLDSTTQGTGLGLYISRGIARAHGGDLVYAPCGPGARFVLDLPLGEPA